LLGETAAVTALIAAQLKQPGRLTLQLRGGGPIQLLIMDCNEQLQMRGMARSNPVVLPAPVPDLLGVHQGGQLLMSLDLPTARQPYQSFVPLVGDSMSAIFEHYLEQSAAAFAPVRDGRLAGRLLPVPAEDAGCRQPRR
jgi:molecular chaperone Hsp33